MLRAMAPISPVNASNSIVSTLQHLQSKYECVVVDFHSTDQTADLAASSTVINGVVVVVEAGQATAESLLGLLRVLPRDKIEAVMVNKIAPGPPDLSAEFAAFVGPLVRASRTALAMMPLLFERLATRAPVAGGEAKLLHPAEFLELGCIAPLDGHVVSYGAILEKTLRLNEPTARTTSLDPRCSPFGPVFARDALAIIGMQAHGGCSRSTPGTVCLASLWNIPSAVQVMR